MVLRTPSTLRPHDLECSPAPLYTRRAALQIAGLFLLSSNGRSENTIPEIITAHREAIVYPSSTLQKYIDLEVLLQPDNVHAHDAIKIINTISDTIAYKYAKTSDKTHREDALAYAQTSGEEIKKIDAAFW